MFDEVSCEEYYTADIRDLMEDLRMEEANFAMMLAADDERAREMAVAYDRALYDEFLHTHFPD
jgi:hypothetical protein